MARSKPKKTSQILERISLHAGAEPLARDGIEVYEPPTSKQLIHLRLSSRVAPHEPLDGTGLVGRVVVDVHGRMLGHPVHHEVDEVLECPLLDEPGPAPRSRGSRSPAVSFENANPSRYSSSPPSTMGSPSISKNTSPSSGAGSLESPRPGSGERSS